MRVKIFFIIIFLVSVFSFVQAEEGEKIRVGIINERKPFVYKNDLGEYSGYSINIWKKIAEKNYWDYEYKVYNKFYELLNSVENGEVDVAVANISITKDRMKKMDFSKPIYNSGIVLLVPDEGAGRSILKTFFKSWIIKVILLILIIYIIICFRLWLIDKKNIVPKYSGFNGLLKLYKDVYLYIFSKKNRLIILLFVLVVLIITFIWVQGLRDKAEVKSLQYSIKTKDDLRKIKVGVAKGTTMEKFAQKNNIKYLRYNDFMDSIRGLERLEVQAVLGSATTSRYYASELSRRKIYLVDGVYDEDNIAFAINKKRKDIKKKIDDKLREMYRRGVIDDLKKIYFKYEY